MAPDDYALDLELLRLELIWADAALAPHAGGVLVIDETGDRKDGTKTAHVAPQYLGSVGKIANGIVSVTSLWADDVWMIDSACPGWRGSGSG